MNEIDFAHFDPTDITPLVEKPHQLTQVKARSSSSVSL